MSKELPYFKFNASEWISGEITLEDLTTQGAFINICAFYWFKSGCLTLTEIKRRLKLKQATIDKLVHANHIKVNGGSIEISFLRQQFDERGHISRRNSENGKKGGAPKGNLNAKNQEKNNREQPETNNIEEEKNKNREEKQEIEGDRFLFFGEKKDFFISVKTKYTTDKPTIIYDLREFVDKKQLELFEKNKWNQFEQFMKDNPGRVFDDDNHVYNSFKNHHTKQKDNAGGFTKKQTNRTITNKFSGDYSERL